MPAPHFLIIGAQKAGTSSLYNILCQHPQICAAQRKEVHFFDQHYGEGRDWYHRQLGAPDAGQLTGEASPFYLAHPLAAQRIHAENPDTKLLILLREPAARAYSHYQHQRRRQVETLDFCAALACEEQRTAKHWLALARGELLRTSNAQMFSYRRRGYYAEQLQRYFQLFPRSQLWIESSEVFFQDPLATSQRCFEFLDIDPSFIPVDFAVRKPGNYQNEDQQTLAELKQHYQAFNQQLFALLGREFCAW